MPAKTMFDKIWERHAILQEADETLLYVDRCLLHEGSSHTFENLRETGTPVARHKQIFAFADHYVPSDPEQRKRGTTAIADPEIRHMVELLESNTTEHGITQFGIADERQGIHHVAGPELGITLPGLVITGGDSHTSTHGAFGNFSFGIGASEVTHVLATQTIWQRRPGNKRIVVDGTLGFGVAPKDLILAIIARIGIGGGLGHVLEYAGSTFRNMSMDERMTVCNMSIEAGARAGMVAPDDTTFQYLAGRHFAPKGKDWDAAIARWKQLPTDDGAVFDAEVTIDGDALTPMITWGTNPGMGVPIAGAVPDPSTIPDALQRDAVVKALHYMNLEPGKPILGRPVNVVFIGSCTNSRITDLRAAAALLKGRKVSPNVRVMVVPGSMEVKRQAIAEGLPEIFRAAGCDYREPGCSMCIAMNGDQLSPGEYSVSTSNRNFEGRQGKGGRTFLASPLTAAASAITGVVTDVRSLM